jgi:protocatechuate 3,4-dioxygenase beta subunit
MRTKHLLVVAALVAAALLGLWCYLGSEPVVVRAASPFEELDLRENAAANVAANANADARGATDAGREALQPVVTEDASAAASAKKTPVKPTVTGRVVDPEGKGVAGACVWASTGTNWVQLPLDVEPEGLPANWIKVKKVESGADGVFVFEDLKPGALRLAARAAGFAPTYLDRLDLPTYEHHALADVRLERGVSVSGKVIGPDGQGVAGVNVLIALDSIHKANLVAVPGRGVPTTTTAADGTFVVDQLSAGAWHLMFDAAGYVLAESDGRLERAGEKQNGLVVRLEKGLEIRGKITGKDASKDAPIPAGLRVSARLTIEKSQRGANDPNGEPGNGPDGDEGSTSESNEIRARQALVAEDGTFTVSGLKSGGRYRLSVSKKTDDERGFKAFTAVEPATATAGEKGVELVFRPESVITLRVLDDTSGEPITEFALFAGIGRERPLRDEKGEVVHTFVDGRARYPELRVPATGSKPFTLRIAAAGYKDHENKNVPIKPGQELDLGEIRMTRERSVIATVIDEATGTIVAGARVILSTTRSDEELTDLSRTPPEQDMWGDTAVKFGRTGADGKAKLTSVPGKIAAIQASAKGFLPSTPARLMLAPDGDQTLELKLKHGGTVIVKVTDGFGHAVAGVGIQHRLPRRNSEDEGATEEGQKSDPQGIVKFEALEPGLHAFQIHEERGDVYFWDEEGSQNDEPHWVESSVAADTIATLDFTAPPRGTVSGHVTEAGRPVEGAHLKFVPRKEGQQQGMAYWGGANDPFSTVTDNEGAYKLENLRCGEYSVLVMNAGRRMAAEFRATITPQPSTRDFQLEISGIEGRVTDSDGRPLAGINVNAYRVKGGLDIEAPYHMVLVEDDRGNPNVNWEQTSRGSDRTDAAGRYALTGLIADEPLVVQVQGEWVEQGSSPEVILAHGETKIGVDFALRLAGKIEVTMQGGGGKRDGWYQVRVSKAGDKDGGIVSQTYVGGWNRTQTMPSIVPGRYKVTVVRHGNESAPPLSEQEVEVTVGQVTRISFNAN